MNVPLTPAERRRGRPPAAIPTTQIAVRLDAELLAALWAAADGAGTSLSDEIRRRLWLTFGSLEKLRYERAWNELTIDAK